MAICTKLSEAILISDICTNFIRWNETNFTDCVVVYLTFFYNFPERFPYCALMFFPLTVTSEFDHLWLWEHKYI